MTWDGTNTVFEVGSAFLLFLTFVFGAGAIYTGRHLNREQAERILTLARDVATQQERAAKAETALLELQEQVRPRSLTPAQRSALLDALRASPNKGQVTVVFGTGDGEAREFAKLLVGVLQEAGWSSQTDADGELVTGTGLSIVVHELRSAPQFAGDLQKILKKVLSLDSNGTEQPDRVPAGEVWLVVLTKPAK